MTGQLVAQHVSQGFTERLLDVHSFRHTAVSVIRGVIPVLADTALDQTVRQESVGSEGARRHAQHSVESLRSPVLHLPRVYSTPGAS